ncbi:RNA-directed DNA polymerase, eukaryota [Tanacetum coccineum]
MDKPTIEDDYGYHQSKQTIHSQLWMIMLSTKDDETELARGVKQHLETEGNGDLIVEDVPESLLTRCISIWKLHPANKPNEVVIGMDVAASGLYEDKGKTYDLNFKEEVNRGQRRSMVVKLVENLPILPEASKTHRNNMATKADSWSDQWGTGVFDNQQNDYEKHTEKTNSNKKMDQIKAVASTLLMKAKSSAVVGANKLKKGATTGFKWIKNKCSCSK